MAKEVVSAPRFYGSSLRRVRSRAACSNGYIISSLKTFWVDPTAFCVEGSTLRPAIQFCFRRGKQWAFPKDSNLRDLAQTPELPVAVINLLFSQILQPFRPELFNTKTGHDRPEDNPFPKIIRTEIICIRDPSQQASHK